MLAAVCRSLAPWLRLGRDVRRIELLGGGASKWHKQVLSNCGTHPVNIVSATQILADHGLDAPRLNVLLADANNYSVLLLQPKGQIEATQAGIRNCDRTLAGAQFGEFLAEATASQADLVVTPEYSTPWDVLRAVIDGANSGPAQGKLWVLGCESIKYRELLRIREELTEIVTVIFEEMNPDDNRFVDALAYVFRTTKSHSDEPQLVVLVQFKTQAMVDPHDFERNSLQVGTKIYQFGTYGAGISLVTIVCSDLLAFTDQEASNVYDRSLILHIQLNNERQHTSLLGFRERLLRLSGDQTELLTLNWAQGTRIYHDGDEGPWNEFAGSAWYLKTAQIALDDGTVAANHRQGFYYTRLESHKAHVSFFNFRPAVFSLTASKVVRLGVAGPVGGRRGPQLIMAKSWDDVGRHWTNSVPLNDGFADLCHECGGAAAQVRSTYDRCPLACERLLALCAGNSDSSLDWFHPGKLDSFALNEREPILRITFCQDIHCEAAEFRIRRLRRCATLWNILQTSDHLPHTLRNDTNGFVLEWTTLAPHQNLRCQSGERATVMYLGEDSDDATIQRTYKAARERVHRSLDEEAGDRAKQRVVLWYRDANGNVQRRWDPPAIDRQRGESEYDIGRMA